MASVSIIIPVYNGEQYLHQCLDSVCAQTLQDIEIICVDDASSDSSPAILQDYAARDPRFHIEKQAHLGPGIARNKGFTKATGRYVIFLDCDDWFETNFLEELFTRAEKTCADITICKAQEFDRTGSLPSAWMLKEAYIPAEVFSAQDISDHIFQLSYGWPWDKLMRRDFVEHLDLQFPELPYSEDLVFTFCALACANRIAFCDRVLIHRRLHENALTVLCHDKPEYSYLAACRLQDELKTHEVYEPYKKSFVRWATEFLIWSALHVADSSKRSDYVRMLKTDWFVQLDLDTLKCNAFGSAEALAKYQLVRHAPPKVVSLIWDAYWVVKNFTLQHKKTGRRATDEPQAGTR